MRHLGIACALLFAANGCGPTGDIAALQGTWDVTTNIQNGLDRTVDSSGTVTFTGTEVKFLFKSEGSEDVLRTFRYGVDEKANPKLIHFTVLDKEHRGVKAWGIYELTGDQLKLAVGHDQAELAVPASFESRPGEPITLYVLKRAGK